MDKWPMELLGVLVFLVLKEHSESLGCHMSVMREGEAPTRCNPTDHSLPGSSVHGILQARILEWVAIPFSRGSSLPRDRIQVPELQILLSLSHQGSPVCVVLVT